MVDQKLNTPEKFSREHVYSFVKWRMSEVKEKSGRSPSLNTALGDLKILDMVLKEADLRHYCAGVVTKNHGMEKDDADEKPEYTIEEMLYIREELIKLREDPGWQEDADWMRIAWEISLGTGCRHKESRIRAIHVNWTTCEILHPSPKGGKRKAFVHAASDDIIRYLRQVFSDGRKITWNLPSSKLKMTGLRWSKFFKKIGLRHLCFHCTRVTYISVGERAGTPEKVMCEQVNHADKEIHRVYSRRPTEERRRYANAIPLPPAVFSGP